MALHANQALDPLQELFKDRLKDISKEQLRAYVNSYLVHENALHPNDYPDLDRLVDLIKRGQWIEHIKNSMTANIVPKSKLEWIKEDTRLNEWVVREMMPLISRLPIKPLFLDKLSNYDKCITCINMATFFRDIAEKLSFVDQMKERYLMHIQNSKKICRWFEHPKESRERLKYAYNYLYEYKDKGNLFVLKNELSSIDGFKDINDVYLLWDRSQLSYDNIMLLIDSLSKAWSRHKHRSKQQEKGESQYNFVLSDKIIKLLDKLSEDYDLSRTGVLEVLIKLEFEKPTHLKGYSLRVEAKRMALEEENLPQQPAASTQSPDTPASPPRSDP